GRGVARVRVRRRGPARRGVRGGWLGGDPGGLRAALRTAASALESLVRGDTRCLGRPGLRARRLRHRRAARLRSRPSDAVLRLGDLRSADNVALVVKQPAKGEDLGTPDGVTVAPDGSVIVT